MDLRQHAEGCPLLEMSAQGRTAELAGGRRQAAPRRPLPEKLAQGGHHPNRRRSGMTPLLRWRAEIDDRRDEVQKSDPQGSEAKSNYLLPCLTLQIWSSTTNDAPHSGCTTPVLSSRSTTSLTATGISGSRLLRPQAVYAERPTLLM